MTKAHVFHELALSWIWHSLLWPIRHLFMLLDFWSWSKRGEKQQMTFRLNSIKSIHITAVEKRKQIDLQRSTHWTELAAHELWKSQLLSDMQEHVWTSQSYNHISYSFQAFAIPGQYAFAHQDVSMFFWVTDICPIDRLLPTPSKPPLCPLYTLLCKDETSLILIFWYY